MTVFIIVIHVIACVCLIALVLIQRGRGSGLVESFHGVESMFGTKTNAFLTRTTTVLSVIFFITCLSLALISIRQSRSLMRSVKPDNPKVGQPALKPEAEKPAAAKIPAAPQKETPAETLQTQEKQVPSEPAPEKSKE